MTRLGVIGLGHMGGYHASICTLLPNVELVGIADLNEKNWTKVKSSKVIKTNDYNKWIDFVDAVIIAVPTEFHHPVAKDCLLRGKHVLLEKPLTRTIQEAQELFSIAKQQNLSLHVGHVERFNGAVQELKKFVNNPYLIECHRLGPFTPRPQKDSVVLDLMIHDLDLVLNLVNSPVQSMNIVNNNVHTKCGDIAILQIKFENGTLANIVSSRASQIKKRTMSVHQKECFLKLDFTTQDISIHSHTSNSVKIGNNQVKYKQAGTFKRLFVYKDNPLKIEIENFVKSIKLGGKSLKPNQDMIALKLALEIEKNLVL
jgi:predicted dehydrogenase